MKASAKQPPVSPRPGPIPTTDTRKFEAICRIRPQQKPEEVTDIVISEHKPTITMTQQAKNITKEFTFDKILKQGTTQHEFTAEMSDKIFNNCYVHGRGSLVLSYGVTNSGKTYTILGTQKEPGLLPVLLERMIQEYPKEQITITAIELYNDEFYSLKNREKLLYKQFHGYYQFYNYQPEEVYPESIIDMVQTYMINRTQTGTKANKKSSRSHAIFKINCSEISVAIVDLAGSQRLEKVSCNVYQTTSINKSLLVLGKCIHAFRDAIQIPFRQSKLTKALVQYFGPYYKIFMVAHINRSDQMFHENLKVLEYATISSLVRHINPHMNRSIFQSVKKNGTKSKSCLKNKKDLQEISIGRHQKKVEVQESVQDAMEFEFARRKKQMMDRYINQMIGRIEENDRQLDLEFEELDRSTEKFIQELRAIRYQSPGKDTHESPKNVGHESPAHTNLTIKKESEMRLRREILSEVRRQRFENNLEVAVDTEDLGVQTPKKTEDQENVKEEKVDSWMSKIKKSVKEGAYRTIEKVLSAVHNRSYKPPEKDQPKRIPNLALTRNEVDIFINKPENPQKESIIFKLEGPSGVKTRAQRQKGKLKTRIG